MMRVSSAVVSVLFTSVSKPAEQARKAQLNAEFRSAREYEVCLHPEAGVACSPRIIAAYTVQRVGGGLSLITRKNKVYGYDPDIFQLDQTGGRISPKLIEIRRASTFTAFWGTHDKELFAPVEDQPFTGSFEQAALLSFRAVAHELWEKRVKVRTHELFDKEVRRRGCLPRFLAERMIGPMKNGPARSRFGRTSQSEDGRRIVSKRQSSGSTNHSL